MITLQHFQIEMKGLYQGRDVRWLQVSAHPRKMADDNIMFDGFVLDVTSRKEAEITLEKHHEELEKFNLRQRVLINILQIMQFPVDFRQALDDALAEIGEYAGVSRVFIVEKNDKATSADIIHEWCNVGISKHTVQKMPMDLAQKWFDLLIGSEIRYFSDFKTFDAESVAHLERNDVKSLAILPLVNFDGSSYGFIGFNDCVERSEWNKEDIELLKSVSKIISISTQRYRSEANLLTLSRRQSILIKVLQVVQAADDLHQAMNEAIAEVGKYAQVCRVHIFEKSQDEKTYGCSYEWCEEYVEPVIHLCQNLPLEHGQPWFDLLNVNQVICASDVFEVNSFAPEIYETLKSQRVKAILSFPLSISGSHFGFINFSVCKRKVWEPKEVKLLSNISQIFTNVIRRRQVETAMNLQQQTMRTVLDNIDAHIVVSEIDTYRVLFANKSFKQESSEDVEDKLCWQARRESAPCDHCHRSVLLDSNGVPTGIHRKEHYNTMTKRWHIIMCTAIKWVNNQLAVMELSTDITDLKLNEIELVRSREKAEESDKLKSAFLANMSHEIRTPLNAIVGFLNIIAAENMLPERELDYFNIMKENAEQLVKLINDIMDVARIEAKQMDIAPVPVNINQLMNELKMLFKTIMKNNKKSRIIIILDDAGSIDNCTILVDPTRLRQVLNNLISNAIKYTEKGYIRFGYRQSAPDKLEFVVEDSGVGIAVNQHELIFERFRQAENHFHEGTGLGLNIAKNLVQMMGGDMWVESTEEVGSAFYFTILYRPVTM